MSLHSSLVGACLAVLVSACTFAPERSVPDPLPEVLAWALPARAEAGFLGLTLVENDSGSLEELAFAEGLRVSDVVQNSPAARAGFQRDDLVLEVEGREVFAAEDVAALVAAAEPGAALRFTVLRGDTAFDVPVTPEAAGGAEGASVPRFHVDRARSRAAWGDGAGGAVLVARPDEGSGSNPVRRLPLGSVVTAVDGKPVTSGRGLVRALARYAVGETVTLTYTPPDGASRESDVRLLNEGRVVTRASVPVLMTYNADLEADRRSFVLLDLYVISLVRYERDGAERRWRVLRFFEWASGVGELGE